MGKNQMGSLEDVILSAIGTHRSTEDIRQHQLDMAIEPKNEGATY